jgi:hypothetical protein
MVMSSDENAVPTKPDKRRSVIAVTAHSRSDGLKSPITRWEDGVVF